MATLYAYLCQLLADGQLFGDGVTVVHFHLDNLASVDHQKFVGHIGSRIGT